MAFWQKIQGVKTKLAGLALVDRGLNRSSRNAIGNDIVSSSLMDGIGGTNEVFKFGTDGNGEFGYIKKVNGADTFVPFKKVFDETVLLPVVDSLGNGSKTTKFYKFVVLHSYCPSGSYSSANVSCGGGVRVGSSGDHDWGQMDIFRDVPAGSKVSRVYAGSIYGINLVEPPEE